MKPSLLVLANVLFLVPGLAGAAPPAVQPKPIEAMEASLTSIEKTVAEVERRKVVPADFDLEVRLESYAEQASSAFREAHDGLGAAAKAGTASAASVKPLQRFESVARVHATRTHALLQRLADLTRKIRTGEVGLPPELLHQLDDQEIAALRDFLAPEVRLRYERVEPRLRAAASASAASPFPDAGLDDAPEHAELRCATRAWHWPPEPQPRSAVERLMDLAVPPAHAALGIGCLAVCDASLGVACASCVGAAGVAAVAMYRGAVEAFDACNRFRPFPRFLCKAGVVAAFIAALA